MRQAMSTVLDFIVKYRTFIQRTIASSILAFNAIGMIDKIMHSKTPTWVTWATAFIFLSTIHDENEIRWAWIFIWAFLITQLLLG